MRTHYKLTIYNRLEGKFKEEYVFTSEEISINPVHFIPMERNKLSDSQPISSSPSKLIKQMKEKQSTVFL